MKKQARKSLEQAIKDALVETGESVNSLAKQSGVSQPVLHRFLSNQRGLTLDTADKLCEFLGLELRKRE